ncbi:MAG: hypothetical protein ACLUKK_11080 [Lacrimispora saccharolytica]
MAELLQFFLFSAKTADPGFKEPYGCRFFWLCMMHMSIIYSAGTGVKEVLRFVGKGLSHTAENFVIELKDYFA